jgi:hypothetical protein
MNRVDLTGNALKHGAVILAGDGRQYRVEWALNNLIYICDTRTNEAVVSAVSQSELRRKIERLDREDVAMREAE